MTSCVALIPARYGSTRLPAKALLDETGRPLVQHVYERVSAARRISDVIVATDDRRILDAVERFGGRAVMTSPEHRSGSDRIAEVAASIEADLVMNVQGDEPEIEPELLDNLVAFLEENVAFPICTAAVPIRDAAFHEDPNTVKVVAGGAPGEPLRALYFSRCPIPHGAGRAGADLEPLKHIGVYAFRREALLAFAAWPPSPLEAVERLEQIRALERGMSIGVVLTDRDSQGIDTPDDYRAFVERWALETGRAGGQT